MSKPLQADDLTIGQWVLINEINQEALPEVPAGMMAVAPRQRPHGWPLKIISIDLPWLFIWNGNSFDSIDSRRLLLQRASMSYVRSIMKHRDGHLLPPKDRRKSRSKKKSVAETLGEALGELAGADQYVSSGFYDKKLAELNEPLSLEELAKHCRPAGLNCPYCGVEMVLARPAIDPKLISKVAYPICPKCGLQGQPIPI